MVHVELVSLYIYIYVGSNWLFSATSLGFGYDIKGVRIRGKGRLNLSLKTFMIN
jgi:hypothetical protein